MSKKYQKNTTALNSNVKKVMYCRVSSNDQNLDRQKENLEGIDLLVEDKISGSTEFFSRDGGRVIKELIDEGVQFTLYVSHVDRCGRNALDILSTVKYCTAHGVNINFYQQGFCTLDDSKNENPVTKLILSILLSVAELTRSQIRDSQRAGIRLSRLKHPERWTGRRKGSSESVEDFLNKKSNQLALSLLKQNKFTLAQISKLSGRSVNSILKLKRIYCVQEGKKTAQRSYTKDIPNDEGSEAI